MSKKVLEIEGAEIVFRNFSGKETDYNALGNRNFAVIVAPEDAEALAADGWNIKTYVPKSDENPGFHYLSVSLRYDPFPPKIYMVSSKGKATLLTEQTVGLLDDMEFAHVDLVLTPYHWSKGSKSGVKAYVREMYVTIVESRFASKYEIYDQEENPFE